MFRWLAGLRVALRSVARPTRVEEELDEEMQFHLERQIEEGLEAGLSTAEARYGDGQRTIELEVVDTGGISGLVGVATWAGVTGEKENDEVVERTRKEGDRLIHEKRSKRAGGTNEFGVVLGGRFVVTAKAEGVELDALKTAVATLDLAKLESMKGAGAKN